MNEAFLRRSPRHRMLELLSFISLGLGLLLICIGLLLWSEWTTVFALAGALTLVPGVLARGYLHAKCEWKRVRMPFEQQVDTTSSSCDAGDPS